MHTYAQLGILAFLVLVVLLAPRDKKRVQQTIPSTVAQKPVQLPTLEDMDKKIQGLFSKADQASEEELPKLSEEIISNILDAYSNPNYMDIPNAKRWTMYIVGMDDTLADFMVDWAISAVNIVKDITDPTALRSALKELQSVWTNSVELNAKAEELMPEEVTNTKAAECEPMRKHYLKISDEWHVIHSLRKGACKTDGEEVPA